MVTRRKRMKMQSKKEINLELSKETKALAHSALAVAIIKSLVNQKKIDDNIYKSAVEQFEKECDKTSFDN